MTHKDLTIRTDRYISERIKSKFGFSSPTELSDSENGTGIRGWLLERSFPSLYDKRIIFGGNGMTEYEISRVSRDSRTLTYQEEIVLRTQPYDAEIPSQLIEKLKDFGFSQVKEKQNFAVSLE